MYYPGIVSYSGMTVGRGGGAVGTALALVPAVEAARTDELRGGNRRHVQNGPLKHGRGADALDTRFPAADVSARRTRTADHWVSALAFLAQHIAQEVTPEVTGRDRHALAAKAYMGARDFNAEMLPQGAGLDIQV